MLNLKDLNDLRRSVQTEYRSVTRIREDLVREGIIHNTVADGLYARQAELSALTEKLDKMISEVR